MKKLLVVSLIALAIPLVTIGCPPSSPPAAPPDTAIDADATLATKVCNHLADVQCAQPSTCAATFAAEQGRLADWKPNDLLRTTSRDEVIALEGPKITCPPPDAGLNARAHR